MKPQRIFGSTGIMLAILNLHIGFAPASTPEPDNILYGHVVFEDAPATAPDLRGIEVQARLVSGASPPGEVLATYTIGDIDRAEANQYVLKIKVDAAPASRPRALEDGGTFALFIDGHQVSAPLEAGGITDTAAMFREVDIALDPGLRATATDVLAHLLGMAPLTGLKLATADINGDGTVNVADYLHLSRHPEKETRTPPPPKDPAV
ncbi:MAG: dockerin type I repeat-containing protein [Sumerlaeia bacterium]